MAFGFFHALSVDHTQVPSNQSNFPVLVNFTDNNFATVANGGKVQNSSGFDIGFYADNNAATKLAWEMERYTATSGEVIAWVKLPTVSSTSPNTTFYVFYDDPTINTDQSNPTGVWDANYLGVYHLKDGTTLSVADSTGQNNGTNQGGTAGAGQVDGCVSLASASSQYVDLGTNMAPTAITLEAWVNATSFPNTVQIVVARSNAGNTAYATIQVNSTGTTAWYVLAATDRHVDPGTNTLSTGTWYHLVMTYSNAAGLFNYVNGVQESTATANGTLNTTSANVYIGNEIPFSPRFWNGLIDEVRISNIARSADWIKATYNNHKPASTFVSKGGQQTPSTFPAFVYAWS